ncbi:hypothetical protein AB8A31_21185 [Tardiphaga sp. 804_B3_N1_9]|uniref:hypothetical protein n=1 Tax=Tardiphaga TaxID=1395974 RepID=UPI0015867C68|nr:hypothetical protein [Tardiphaga robiniae]NUU45245.1 hypothetical protein [Tardiphaga robiniae]
MGTTHQSISKNRIDCGERCKEFLRTQRQHLQRYDITQQSKTDAGYFAAMAPAVATSHFHWEILAESQFENSGLRRRKKKKRLHAALICGASRSFLFQNIDRVHSMRTRNEDTHSRNKSHRPETYRSILR